MKFREFNDWYKKQENKSLFYSVFFKVGEEEEEAIQSFYISLQTHYNDDDDVVRLSVNIGESKRLPQNVYTYFKSKTFDNVEDAISFGKLECSKINQFFDSYK